MNLITSTEGIRVEMCCDTCSTSPEVACGGRREELGALTEGLRRTLGWGQTNGKDLCPRCYKVAKVVLNLPEENPHASRR